LGNAASAGGPIVDTGGFETPVYSPTGLVGQNGWVTSGGGGSTAVVQSTIKQSGNQALRVDRASFSDDRYTVPVDNYPTGRFVYINWDMRFEQATGGGSGPFFGVDAYDDDGTLGVLGALGVDVKSGEVLFQLQNSGVLVGTGAFVGFDIWANYGLLLDFNSNSYRTYVNNVFLTETGFVDLGLGVNEFTDADIATFSSAGDTASRNMTGTAYFDNFLVTDGIPGDFDQDGDVDAGDLSMWNSSFGVNGAADSTGDGQSSGSDFLAWQGRYALDLYPATAVASAVPEPASVILGLCAMAGFAMRWGHTRGLSTLPYFAAKVESL
jgi:hypothetical protein